MQRFVLHVTSRNILKLHVRYVIIHVIIHIATCIVCLISYPINEKKCKKHRTVSLNTEYFKCFATEPTLDLSSRLNQHNDDEDRQFDSHGKLS